MQNSEFASQLKRLLESLGMTQKDLAEATGIAQSSITGWMKGSIPGGKSLKALADFFGVSEGALLNGGAVYELAGNDSEIRIRESASASDVYCSQADRQIAFEQNMYRGLLITAEKNIKRLEKENALLRKQIDLIEKALNLDGDAKNSNSKIG